MQINTSMNHMTMKMNKFIVIFLTLTLFSCSLSPGMHMNNAFNNHNDKEIQINGQDVQLKTLESYLRDYSKSEDIYRIGNGDQISITVWGLPDIFPMTNINSDQNLRRVDSNGDIYFPYVGIMKAEGKTQNALRADLEEKLSKFFTDPQLDVSIARFNSQKVYLLGEVTRPQRINLTDINISLTDAIGEVNGLRTETSAGNQVFVIRQSDELLPPIIIKVDLQSPSGLILAEKLTLKNNDIVFVNAKSTTRWNRVISQFFPFSSFLNSVDNLIQKD